MSTTSIDALPTTSTNHESTSNNSLKLNHLYKLTDDSLVAVPVNTTVPIINLVNKAPHLQLPLKPLKPLSNTTNSSTTTNNRIEGETSASGVKLVFEDPPDSPEFRTEATVLSENGTSEINRGAEESWNAVLDSFERSRAPGPATNGITAGGSSSSSLRSPPLPNVPSPFGTNGRSKSNSLLVDGQSSLSATDVPADTDSIDPASTIRRDSNSSQSSTETLTTDLAGGRYEEERRRVVKRFGLDGTARREAIDRCAAVAKSHFHTPTVIISLVLENKQVLAAEIGWEGEGERDELGNLRELPLNLDVLQRLDTEDCYVMLDARQDWRLNEVNPYEREGGRLSFFASAPIHLPTLFPELPLSVGSTVVKPPSTLPVGMLAIIDREPRKKSDGFTEEDRMVLKSIADQIAREFQLGYEQMRRETEAKQTLFLGEFLRTALVNPSRADKPLASDPHLKPHSTEPGSTSKKISDSQIQAAKGLIFQEAAQNLTHLTQADSAVIIDLRAFSAPFPPASLLEVAKETGIHSSTEDFDAEGEAEKDIDGFSGESSRWGSTFSGIPQGTGAITVMGQEGQFDWFSSVDSPDCASSVSQFLNAFYLDHISEFDSGTVPSPLAKILPSNTEASISVIIFDHDSRPCLLLVLCSSTKYFRFEPTDRQFVENVGAVAVGSLMRRRILEADRAKLAFVSQISHELRTPLHGIGSQIELIREVSTPSALIKLKPLLDTADVCISSLREVLDDTLEFAKISNSTQADVDATTRSRQLTEVNLEKLVEEVAKSCWTRTRKNAAVAGDGKGKVEIGTTGAGASVDVIIEMDPRLVGTSWHADVGAIKRVLLNLLGNSLKFTDTGSIVIKVFEEALPLPLRQTDLHMIQFAVQDTGIGMKSEFVREALFIPFLQQNSFSNGAGLGVSICDSIVRSLHGTLHFESTFGVGTAARVLLPMKIVSNGNSSPVFPLHPLGPPLIRNLSVELASMLDPLLIISGAAKAEVEAQEQAATREQELLVLPVILPVILPSGVVVPLPSTVGVMQRQEDTTIKVLVVEDNAISRRILTTLLKTKGIPFEEATNGVEAIEKYKSFLPNVVWSDIQMPIMDGIKATEAIRIFEMENNLTPAFIVALTGLSSESRLHKESLTSGQFDSWVVKGGPSLKVLTAGLARQQTLLRQLALRRQLATTLQEGAKAILDGHFPICLPSFEQLSSGGLEN